MFMKHNSRRIFALTLAVAIAQGCSKKEDKDEDESNSSGTVAGSGSAPAGVEAPQTGEIALYGTLSESAALNLAGNAFDKVLAFQIVGGEIQDVGVALEYPVGSDGRFGFNLPSEDPSLTKLIASENPDGTYDRAKLSEAVGETIGDDVSDAEIKSHIDEEKLAAANGGLSWALVSMVSSTSDDKVAEAQSFQFIGLQTSGSILNGIPVNKAKSNIDLGTVTGSGDQAVGELELTDGIFDLGLDTLKHMASSSNAIKILKNNWMNSSKTGPSVDVTPFYMWSNTKVGAKAAYSDPAANAYGGMGMYLGVRNSPFTFDQLCGGTVSVTLTPPADIVTTNYGTINAANPFNNAGLGAIGVESTRSNCNGSATGFYGAGEPGGTELMINWGTGGSMTTAPEGLWEMAYDGTSLAHFELASSSPVDSAGKPKVFIPSVQVSVDANNNISRIDVKMYLFDGTAYVELTDPQAFRQVVTGLNVELTNYNGNSRTDERVTISDKLEGNVFYALSADYANTYDFDSSTIAIYYEMFGGSYRLELRN